MEAFLTKAAVKQYGWLNEPMLSRIDDAIDGLEKEPPEGSILPLGGKKGIFRLKVGGYRILFRKRGEEILVTHIEPRGQAYGKKNMEAKQ